MDDKQLAEIEARAKAATEGPWHRRLSENPGLIRLERAGAEGKEKVLGYIMNTTLKEICENPHAPVVGLTPQNAAFIAHARQDIPDLIAEVRELQKRLKRWEPQMPDLDESIRAAQRQLRS